MNNSETRSASPRRPRIVLSAYACYPNWGSEPGVGWARATHLAKYCDVWVLTQRDGGGPGVDGYLREHGPIPHLNFVFVPHKRWELRLAGRPVVNYVAYRCWLRREFQVARQLHSELRFDIAHHITFNGFREPSYLYQLGIPFVWGPVGGAQNYPWRFLPGAGISCAAQEAARTVLNAVQMRTSTRVRAAARSAAALFAANPENERQLHHIFGVEPIHLCDVGVDAATREETPPRSNSDKLRILWVGRLENRKAPELLLRALALLPHDVPYSVRVIGEGPLLRRSQRLAERYGVSANVRWCGRVPHEEAMKQFRWADVLVFTSLRDTTGTVVLEALGAGTPVICLNHQGAGAVVTPDCGVKIPLTNRREVERRLCDAISSLARNRDRCRELGEGAIRRAGEYLWSHQARRIAEEYNRILKAVGSDARCQFHDDVETSAKQRHEKRFDAKSARVRAPIREKIAEPMS